MEYLQTGVLRTSEGPREGGYVLVNVRIQDSFQEQNLTVGRRESALGQGLGFKMSHMNHVTGEGDDTG